MLLIRRLYVYVICAVSLAVLTVGLINLLQISIAEVWDLIVDRRIMSGATGDVRQQISLNLALVAVALPIWGLHWYLAERWVLSSGEQSDRGSIIRAFFLAVVIGSTVIQWGISIGTIIFSIVSYLLGTEPFLSSDRDVINATSVLTVGLVIWAYHVRIRFRDTGLMVMAGPSVWPVRFVVLGSALVGLIFLTIGVARLLLLAVEIATPADELTRPSLWWQDQLATSVGLMLTGLLIWLLHWGYTVRMTRSEGWLADSERSSQLRLAYIYLVILIGVSVTLGSLSVSIGETLRELFGVDAGVGADPLWARLVNPIVIAIPFVVLWATHRFQIQAEREAAAIPAHASLERVYTYFVALVGLAFSAVGSAYLLGVLLEFAFDRARIIDTDPDWVPGQVSVFLAITIVGASTWLWHWMRAQREVIEHPETARIATMRRVYLYLILTATTLALLGTLAYVLYQALQILLGVRSGEGIGSDIGTILGIAIVAGSLLAYHLVTLRSDMREATPESPVVHVEAPRAVPAVSEPAPAHWSVMLRLTAPADVDRTHLLQQMQAEIPPGSTLQIVAEVEPVQPGVTDNQVSDDADHKPEPVESSEPGDGDSDNDEKEPESRIYT